MKKKSLMVWMAVVVLSIALAGLAYASQKVTQLPGINLGPRVENAANGGYTVSVLVNGSWKQVGLLRYDRFVQEREIDLSSITGPDKSGSIRVRLTQQGGGAAHIDSVHLGGNAPLSVAGSGDPRALRKVSKKDFDVVNAFGKSIELAFPAKGTDRKLTLAARVEAHEISTTPFQYPLANLYRPMTAASQFYSYTLGAGTKKIPLFREFYPSGSGHPSGTTYGWVTNDDRNLYVRMDFTADNTMDGGKDYAKVYVKTEQGLKEFKVSVPDTKWGKADFTYTDTVAYQHKVYEFAIPLSEAGVSAAAKGKELQLAFAAYGTASPPGDNAGAVAYDPDNNRYLVVSNRNIGTVSSVNYDIYGQLVDRNGAAIGAAFAISSNSTTAQMHPAVAYDSVNKRFLVAWSDYRNSGTTGYDIYGQLVNADGSLYGTAVDANFVISNAAFDGYNTVVAYDAANKRFLVAWADYRNSATTNIDIYGQMVNADGTLYETPSTSNFPISNASSSQTYLAISYDSINKRYLVVWTDHRNSGTTNIDVYGQIVNADTTLYVTASNANFVISNAADIQDNPKASYDSTNGRHLVAWRDNRNGGATPSDIYAQLLGADGSLNGTNFVISDAADYQTAPALAYDGTNKRYLVAWADYRNSSTTNWDIYGQFVNANGTLSGAAANVNFAISTMSNWQDNVSLAANSRCSNFLAVYRSTDNATTSSLGMSLIGDPCETAPPTVSTTSPVSGATDVAVTAAVTATFSESLDPSTITATSFTLKDSSEAAVAGTVAYDDATKTATFTRAANLTSGMAYTATVSTGVKDLMGNAMAAVYSWSFTTSVAVVSNNAPTSPQLLMPTNGQTNLGTTVAFRWNKATDPDGDTLTHQLYYCTDQAFAGCTGVDVASGKRLPVLFAGLSSGVFLLGFLTSGRRGGKTALPLLIALLLITGGVLIACGGGGGGGGALPGDSGYVTSDLASGTTYYWKVVADDGKGGATSSEVWSFTTQ